MYEEAEMLVYFVLFLGGQEFLRGLFSHIISQNMYVYVHPFSDLHIKGFKSLEVIGNPVLSTWMQQVGSESSNSVSIFKRGVGMFDPGVLSYFFQKFGGFCAHWKKKPEFFFTFVSSPLLIPSRACQTLLTLFWDTLQI